MADIGRILLIPQGNYNSAVVYNMLDVVKHSATKASWVSKTDNNQGNTPVDGSNYWQKLCDDGVGIANVEQTTTSTDDYGENIITVTLTDGTTKAFSVRNGRKGSTGAAAGFGTCTASFVEDNVNLAPHVNVYASGSDTAKTFDFEFSNVNGSQWYKGNEISGGSSSSQVFPSSEVAYANVRDCYINLTEGKVYECTKKGTPSVAEWKYILTLSGGGGGVWGGITGTLTDQTDLKNALDSKADASNTYSKTDVDSLLDDKADATDIIIDSVTLDLDITNMKLGLATSVTEKLANVNGIVDDACEQWTAGHTYGGAVKYVFDGNAVWGYVGTSATVANATNRPSNGSQSSTYWEKVSISSLKSALANISKLTSASVIIDTEYRVGSYADSKYSFYFYKKAGIVFVKFAEIMGNIPYSQNVLLNSQNLIPLEFRPTATMYFDRYIYVNNTNKHFRYCFQPTGQIYIYNYTGAVEAQLSIPDSVSYI